ncbi:MAG: hypothetical protein RBS19_06770 [Bacteroidales bacterium]|nr:hypothetical protein [Bacteroidales bacterium]MDY0216639.1 hypothetical protein [Bacteroidales bacterium]
MKAVFITYNLALTEKVDFMLDSLEIRGYTQWGEIYGRGSKTGNPHMGTHTWPEFNSGIIAVVEDEKVPVLLQKIKNLDHIDLNVGIRAFVWDVVDSY